MLLLCDSTLLCYYRARKCNSPCTLSLDASPAS
jgi:hypothetical protein